MAAKRYCHLKSIVAAAVALFLVAGISKQFTFSQSFSGDSFDGDGRQFLWHAHM
jgi:hypothetical protein